MDSFVSHFCAISSVKVNNKLRYIASDGWLQLLQCSEILLYFRAILTAI